MPLNPPTADPPTAERLSRAQEFLASMPGDSLIEKLTAAFWHITIAGGPPGDAACAAYAIAGTALCPDGRRVDVHILADGATVVFPGDGSPSAIWRAPDFDGDGEPVPVPSVH